MGLAYKGPGTQWDWDTVVLIRSETGTQWSSYTVGLGHNGPETQWNRETVVQIHSVPHPHCGTLPLIPKSGTGI